MNADCESSGNTALKAVEMIKCAGDQQSNWALMIVGVLVVIGVGGYLLSKRVKGL